MAKIIAPVITVLDQNEKPDYEGNKKVIDFLIEGGLDGILVLGSAGEFPNLNVQDKLEFFRFYAMYTADRVELLAGTGCVSYQDTLTLSRAVCEMGYTAPIVICPYYFHMDQEQIFHYYDRLAKDLGSNFYLYNYPQRSGCNIEPDTVRRLVEANPNIIGMKDSVREPAHTNLVCRAVEGHNFSVYSGFDDQFLQNLTAGGCGNIGGFANIVPELWSDLVRAVNKMDFKRTMALHHLIQKLMPLFEMDKSCSMLFKKLLIHRGLDISGVSVCPFEFISEEVCNRAFVLLDRVLEEYRALYA